MKNIIYAKEAQKLSEKNSKLNLRLEEISKEILKACEEGEYHCKVDLDYVVSGLQRELERLGYTTYISHEGHRLHIDWRPRLPDSFSF